MAHRARGWSPTCYGAASRWHPESMRCVGATRCLAMARRACSCSPGSRSSRCLDFCRGDDERERRGNTMITLTTERLILRIHAVTDLDACAAMWGDPEVVKFI